MLDCEGGKVVPIGGRMVRKREGRKVALEMREERSGGTLMAERRDGSARIILRAGNIYCEKIVKWCY